MFPARTEALTQTEAGDRRVYRYVAAFRLQCLLEAPIFDKNKRSSQSKANGQKSKFNTVHTVLIGVHNTVCVMHFILLQFMLVSHNRVVNVNILMTLYQQKIINTTQRTY